MKIKTKSKFFGLINSKYQMLEEQPVDPTAQMSMTPGVAPDPAATAPAPDPAATAPAPEPEVKQLTPEGEVELIRLIRKALVLEPTEGSIPSSILDDEINEENGREILAKMKSFMNTYSDDPDIDY
jgi:hypothetical protein